MWILVFLAAALLVALTPGANNLLGLQHGMRYGAVNSMIGLTGRLAAFALMIGAVVAGLGPLLAASELALTVLKWAGVAYLVWLGGRTLWTAFRERRVQQQTAGAGPELNRFRLARKEFLTAVTNPKAVLIFTAFVPQFVDSDHGPVWWQLTVLGMVYLVAEAIAGSGYALAGGMLGAARMSRRARRRLDQGTGVVLLGMAGALAVEGTG